MNIPKLQTDLAALGLYTGRVDGIWGPKTEAAWTAWAARTIIEGSTFPYDDYKAVSVTLNQTIRLAYLPSLDRALVAHTKGIKLLATIMTHIEGFTSRTRSYRTNNPANIGNTDTGANRTFMTLEDGIRAQADYLIRVATGKHEAYPIGGILALPPFYSDEIARNRAVYGIPPQLPGYRFLFTGRLDQVVKIYSTGARVLNAYVNQIVSYFAQHGYTITPENKLADIIELC